jgi:hypothetical protein
VLCCSQTTLGDGLSSRLVGCYPDIWHRRYCATCCHILASTSDSYHSRVLFDGNCLIRREMFVWGSTPFRNHNTQHTLVTHANCPISINYIEDNRPLLLEPMREESHRLRSGCLLTETLRLTSRSPANIPSGVMCIVSCDALGLNVATNVNKATVPD